MEKTIFKYKSYKAFISEHLKRGEQRSFAEHLGCQPAFLSQVLRSAPNLSLEQGVKVQSYFNMTKIEFEFFMNLLQLEKAGSVELKKHFKDKIEGQLSERKKVSYRVKKNTPLQEHIKERYYSSWEYSWIHVLTSIKTVDQLKFLEQKTGLNRSRVIEVLEFLEKCLLIKKHQNRWKPSENKIHIKDSERQVKQHHRNFRLKTIENIEKNLTTDLHFSSFISLSEESSEALKDIILQMIEDAEKIISPSKEETSRVLCIDFFKV